MSLLLAPLDGRLSLKGLLGAGGMGQVHRAWDQNLERAVAVKFVRGGDPKEAERLLLEARLQARVEHPNVVRVHEVGTIEGRPCIVMQLVEGGTLAAYGNKGPLELRVDLLRQAALGLHAAHLQGLIHRDVKPGNVLTEATEDGKVRALVSDFGLARDEEGGLTRSGMPAGTLGFMAPEVLLGTAPVDFRADVYGMGAMAYALFSGRAPFTPTTARIAGTPGARTTEDPGEGGAMLRRILEEDPPPLTSLPRDLRIVVAKAMEKAPGNRYPSAEAFAEDLRRFLAGEPILAQPPGTLARAGRWLHRHPFITAAGLTAALSVAGFGIYLSYQQQAHTRQLYVAQRCDLLATEAEGILHQAWMMREHDLSREKAIARTRMEAIRGEMRFGGPGTEGPGNFALARIHLAMDDPERAQECLERAWRLGHRPPELASALAGVLGTRYHETLQQQIVPGLGESLRQSRMRAIEARFRDQALALFGGPGSTPPPMDGYAQALQAFLRRDFARTTALARDYSHDHPWHLESRWLQIRTCYVEAQGLAWERGDLQGARARIEEGLRVCEEALQEARSSPRLLHERALLRSLLAQVEKIQGRLQPALVWSALEAADAVLRVDPGHAQTLATCSFIHMQWGDEQLLNRGENPRAELTQAIRDGEASLEAGLGKLHRPQLLATLMLAHIRLADQDLLEGKDPRPAAAEARRLFQGVVELDPTQPNLRARFPLALHDEAVWRFDQGEDPFPAWAEADRIYRQGYAFAPENVVLLNNHAFSLGLMLECRLVLGREAGPELEDGIQACRKGIGINPRIWQLRVNLGVLLALRGAFRARLGQDPGPDWRDAEQQLTQDVPTQPRGLGCRAKLFLWEGRYAGTRGGNADPWLRRAREAALSAVATEALQPDAAVVLVELSRLPAFASLAVHPAVRGLRARFPRHPVFR